jgi:hypothetical protein
MVLDALKPKSSKTTPEYDPTVVKSAVVQGIKEGNVYDCHSAVYAAVQATGVKLSGNEVCGTFDSLLAEVKKMNLKADKLARDGMTTSEIEIELSGENNFTYGDIEAMKIEVYGSVDNWLAKMTADEV